MGVGEGMGNRNGERDTGNPEHFACKEDNSKKKKMDSDFVKITKVWETENIMHVCNL